MQQQEDTATVIGESLLITGDLSGDEDMTVLGRVEGSIQLDKTLFVAPDGIVKADVHVGNAVISGIVIGNVTASESVQITETGRLVGDLQAPRIVIVAGARVRGQVDMSDAQKGRRGDARAEVPAEAGDAKHNNQALARAPSGRFQRLGLPQRRPMPQPLASVRRTQAPAEPQRAAHKPAETQAQGKSTARPATAAAAAPASRRSAHSKRRSHGRRRD